MIEKSPPQPTHSQGKSRFFTTGVIVWCSLAAASLLYLALLVTAPATVAHYLGTGSSSSAESEAAARAANEAVAEVGTLRDTIDQFRNELVEMRAQISSQTDANRDLSSRVETLETATADSQHVAKDGRDQAAAKIQGTKAPTKPAPPPAKTAAADAKKKVAEAKKALETGSVASPSAPGVIAFGPPVVTPTALPPPGQGKLIGVQIATGPSVDSLRLNWALLTDRHGETLRAYQPRYVTGASGNESSYDLVVGPLASVEAATRLCQELAMKATPCSVSRYTGDAL